MGGIEPPSSVYKTAALPLSYTGIAGVGIAPTPPAYETGVLLLDHPALLVEMKGLEPPSSPCKSDVLPLNYIPG